MNINIKINIIERETEEYKPEVNPLDSPFSATKHTFLSYFAGHSKFTYDEWLTIPDDDKAAALFLTFYDQITFAWYKARNNFYADESEAVETILQYLQKNVPHIKSNSSKFSQAYIYRVAYNCLYCIVHDRKCDKERREFEISNIQSSNNGVDEVVDLFDTCISGTLEDDFFKSAEKDHFWKLIKDIDTEALDIAMKLINGESLGRSKDAKRRAAEIIEKMKVVLKDYHIE